MKKLFIPLLCIGLLTACNIDMSQLSGESEKDKEPTQVTPSGDQTPGDGDGTTTPTDGDSTPSTPGTPSTDFKEKTVTFYNGGFTSTTLDQQGSKDSFVAWFNGTDNVLSSIDCSGLVQLNYIGDVKDSWRFTTMTLGSQNNTGELVFNFSVNVSKVKFTVQPYTKYISYNNTYSMDHNSVFVLNGEEHSLAVDEEYTGETEQKEFEKEFSGGTKTITIANKENRQRVFVHSLTITY